MTSPRSRALVQGCLSSASGRSIATLAASARRSGAVTALGAGGCWRGVAGKRWRHTAGTFSWTTWRRSRRAVGRSGARGSRYCSSPAPRGSSRRGTRRARQVKVECVGRDGWATACRPPSGDWTGVWRGTLTGSSSKLALGGAAPDVGQLTLQGRDKARDGRVPVARPPWSFDRKRSATGFDGGGGSAPRRPQGRRQPPAPPASCRRPPRTVPPSPLAR